jgi:hypothetical protein
MLTSVNTRKETARVAATWEIIKTLEPFESSRIPAADRRRLLARLIAHDLVETTRLNTVEAQRGSEDAKNAARRCGNALAACSSPLGGEDCPSQGGK